MMDCGDNAIGQHGDCAHGFACRAGVTLESRRDVIHRRIPCFDEPRHRGCPDIARLLHSRQGLIKQRKEAFRVEYRMRPGQCRGALYAAFRSHAGQDQKPKPPKPRGAGSRMTS